jgi:hypothetical protein
VRFSHRMRINSSDDNLPSCSIARRLGELRATFNKGLGLRFGAVIDSEVVPGREQIPKPTCIASCLLARDQSMRTSIALRRN